MSNHQDHISHQKVRHILISPDQCSQTLQRLHYQMDNAKMFENKAKGQQVIFPLNSTLERTNSSHTGTEYSACNDASPLLALRLCTLYYFTAF